MVDLSTLVIAFERHVVEDDVGAGKRRKGERKGSLHDGWGYSGVLVSTREGYRSSSVIKR